MRDRTPSADDTPKRAPPAPPGEADEAVRKAAGPASAKTFGAIKMVASTHGLDDIGVSQLANVSHNFHGNCSNFQSHHHPYGKIAPSTQDKRSRLSNVINNLHKKVPEQARCDLLIIKEEGASKDNVVRGLETLEKYVMTVLNGAVEDEVKTEKDGDLIKDTDGSLDVKESDGILIAVQPPNVSLEPTEAVESKVDATVPSINMNDKSKDLIVDENVEVNTSFISQQQTDIKVVGLSDVSNVSDCELYGTKSNVTCVANSSESVETLKNNLSLPKCDLDLELVCKEVLNDVLNKLVNELEKYSKNLQINLDISGQSLHCSLPLDRVGLALQNCPISSSVSTLPASSLPSTPSSSSNSISSSSHSSNQKPSKSSSPLVRTLCLFCDRKFNSPLLKQRHTDIIHRKTNAGRRSERNLRKSLQNCIYCAERNIDNLECLFRHMVSDHGDKYHGCLQCSTRYVNKDALKSHINAIHGAEPSRKENDSLQKDSVSEKCNKRLSLDSSADATTIKEVVHDCCLKDSSFKSDSSKEEVLEDPLPNDVSLIVDFPVNKADNEATASKIRDSSSEHISKMNKPLKSHLRKIPYGKYKFPNKYDGKEEWSCCSFKDLSKFDISTQLTLRKKQELIKDKENELSSLNREKQKDFLINVESGINNSSVDKQLFNSSDNNAINDNVNRSEMIIKDCENKDEVEKVLADDNDDDNDKCENNDNNMVLVLEDRKNSSNNSTVFSNDFQSFIKLKKLESGEEDIRKKDNNYAELTGEWSRPRIYVCGACADRHVSLKDLEEHKCQAHPNVWVLHYEFAGDQLDLYQHLYMPGRNPAIPTPATRSRQPVEKVCTKCSKICQSFGELHRHILECGGDQTWLLGLFGNGKKKSKWRPFGFRSRRRRQRGMKRNIQNSQTHTRVNVPRERTVPSGPRVRPSDRESIQKMLANLPAKRSTRKVLQENAVRTQSGLKNVRSRSGINGNPASRIVKNKEVIRNKLLKNAKSFQRKKRLNNFEQADAKQSQIVNANIDNPSTSVENNSDRNKTEEVEEAKQVKSVKSLRNIRVLATKLKNSNQIRTRGIAKRKGLIAEKNPNDTSKSFEIKGKRKLSEDKVVSSKSADIEGRKSAQNLRNTRILANKLSNNDSTRLLTRSKLRAAARSAWQEHTSKMLTRRSSELNATAASASETLNQFFPETATVAIKQKGSRASSRNSSINGSNQEGKEALDDKGSAASQKCKQKPQNDCRSLDSTVELRTRGQKAQGSQTPEMKTKKSNTLPKCSKNKISLKVDVNLETSLKEEKAGLVTRSNSKAKLKKKNLLDVDATQEEFASINSSSPSSITTPKKGNLKRILTDEEIPTISPPKKDNSVVLRKSLRTQEAMAAKEIASNNTNSPDKSEMHTNMSNNVSTTILDQESEKIEPQISISRETEECNTISPNNQQEKFFSKKILPKRKGRTKNRSVEINKTKSVEVLKNKIDETISLPNEASSHHNDIVNTIIEPKCTDLEKNNIENLNLESSNSNMDSGKENSLESTINKLKIKVGKPKKLRAKEKASKRSLSCVIGILTEGVNVASNNLAVDTQDNVANVNSSLQINNIDPCESFSHSEYENKYNLSVENDLKSADSESSINLSINLNESLTNKLSKSKKSDVETERSKDFSQQDLVENKQVASKGILNEQDKEENKITQLQNNIENDRANSIESPKGLVVMNYNVNLKESQLQSPSSNIESDEPLKGDSDDIEMLMGLQKDLENFDSAETKETKERENSKNIHFTNASESKSTNKVQINESAISGKEIASIVQDENFQEVSENCHKNTDNTYEHEKVEFFPENFKEPNSMHEKNLLKNALVLENNKVEIIIPKITKNRPERISSETRSNDPVNLCTSKKGITIECAKTFEPFYNISDYQKTFEMQKNFEKLLNQKNLHYELVASLYKEKYAANLKEILESMEAQTTAENSFSNNPLELVHSKINELKADIIKIPQVFCKGYQYSAVSVDNKKSSIKDFHTVETPLVDDTINQKSKFNSNTEQPINDIVLDLSRRKPKSKGSFLEKIVSKIAKKKDVSLEGEIPSHGGGDNEVMNLSKKGDEISRTVQNSNEIVIENKEERILPITNLDLVIESVVQNYDKPLDDPNAKLYGYNVNNIYLNCQNKRIDKFIESSMKKEIFKKSENKTNLICKINENQSLGLSTKISLESSPLEKNKRKSLNVSFKDDDKEISLSNTSQLMTVHCTANVTDKDDIKSGQKKSYLKESSDLHTKDSEGTKDSSNTNARKTSRKSKRNQTKNFTDAYDTDQIDTRENPKDLLKDNNEGNTNLQENSEKDYVKTNLKIKHKVNFNEVLTNEIEPKALETAIIPEERNNAASKIDEANNSIDTTEKLNETVNELDDCHSPKTSLITQGFEDKKDSLKKTENFGMKGKPRKNTKIKSSRKSTSKKEAVVKKVAEISEDSEKINSINETSCGSEIVNGHIPDQNVQSKCDEVTDTKKLPKKKRVRISNDSWVCLHGQIENIPKRRTQKIPNTSSNHEELGFSNKDEKNIRQKRVSDRIAKKKEECAKQNTNLTSSIIDSNLSLNSQTSNEMETESLKLRNDCLDVSTDLSDNVSDKKTSETNINNISNEKISEDMTKEIIHGNVNNAENLNTESEKNDNESEIIQERHIEVPIVQKENHNLIESIVKDINLESNEVSDIEVNNCKTTENVITECIEHSVIAIPENLANNENDTDSVSKEMIQEQDKNQQNDIAESVNESAKENTLVHEIDQTSNSDIQLPKKRSAGDFIVAHTKAGEILIVEKKKKLTKEIAKFFCDVCATSFTRKSSLKKHNSSQAHIILSAKANDKEKSIKGDLPEDSLAKENDKNLEKSDGVNSSFTIVQCPEINKNIFNEAVEKTDIASFENKQAKLQEENISNNSIEENVQNGTEDVNCNDSKVQPKENEIVEKDLVKALSVETPGVGKDGKISLDIGKNIENIQKEVMGCQIYSQTRIENVERITSPPISREEALEEEMLDEEICKITENMSHDEYVLTDHISPLTPEPAEIPIKLTVKEVKKVFHPKKGVKGIKQKEINKKSLADEHLSLDTPEPNEKNVESVENQKVTKNIEISTKACAFQLKKEMSTKIINESAVEVESASKVTEPKEIKSREIKNLLPLDEVLENKRSSRSQAHKVMPTIQGNSRPKRSQQRPSYKEDDNIDIEIKKKSNSLPNVSQEESTVDDPVKKDDDNQESFAIGQSKIKSQKRNSRFSRTKNCINESHKKESVIDTRKDISIERSISPEDIPIALRHQNVLREELFFVQKKQEILIKQDANAEIQHAVSKPSEKDIDAENAISEKSILGIKDDNQKDATSNNDEKGDITESKKQESEYLFDESCSDNNEPENASMKKLASRKMNARKERAQKTQFKSKVKENLLLKNNEQLIIKDEEHSDFLNTADFAPSNKSNDEVKEAEEAQDSKCSERPLSSSNTIETIKVISDLKNDFNNSAATEFDSDENSLDTKMSADIQKLLDDPEMTAEIAKATLNIEESKVNTKSEDNSKEQQATVYNNNAEPEILLEKKKATNKIKKSAKVTKDKKSKKLKLNKKFVSINKASTSSGSDDSDFEDKNCIQSKNKIVKSVFGRVFGEKSDKNKEAVDENQTNLDLDNLNGKSSKLLNNSRKSRTCKKASNKSTTSSESSRSRRSKKRAEELISRTFYDDSPIFSEKSKNYKQKLSKSRDISHDSQNSFKENDKILENSSEDIDLSNEENTIKNSKQKFKSKEIHVQNINQVKNSAQPKINNDMSHPSFCNNSISGESSIESDFEHDEINDFYSANSCVDKNIYSDNSLNATSCSEENQEQQAESIKNKRSYSSFSGEKFVIKSPSNNCENHSEVLKIAPTSVVGHNTPDVEIYSNQQKSNRQGKVLNFDEELFVECCSRLKAASATELRGAKKIKLDHSDNYHRKDDHLSIYRSSTRDRWREVESRNNLGSLLESVNQLLGEDYNSQEKEYARRSEDLYSGYSSRSDSPLNQDHLGYDDSLDVAFAHNNKLRDKIQQRMRESENLISSSLIHKKGSDESLFDNTIEEEKHKTKVNNSFGGMLDKALSNLLHSGEKHDNHASTPMKLLAELACARAPSITAPKTHDEITENVSAAAESAKLTLDKNSALAEDLSSSSKKSTKIIAKQIFERKKSIFGNAQKKRFEPKLSVSNSIYKIKKQDKKSNFAQSKNKFPLIRSNQQQNGMPEKKKRKDSSDRKKEVVLQQNKVKDIYDFEEEETQVQFSASYRFQNDNNKAKENSFDMSNLITKTINDTLKNGKNNSVGERLQSMVDRKFSEIDKTKSTKIVEAGANIEEESNIVVGPMDEFIERKRKPKPNTIKNNKSKKKVKGKKKSRNAWYETDSSDEFVTAAKAGDIGVGITKSQRTCSKGKQNLFAESSTSTESDDEVEESEDNVEEENFTKLGDKPIISLYENDGKEIKDHEIENDNKKDESELSDNQLVIDEKKEAEESKSSGVETDSQNGRALEFDDLYREDSSSALNSDQDTKTNEKLDSDASIDKEKTKKKNNIKANLKKSFLAKSAKTHSEHLDDTEVLNLPEKLSSNEKPDHDAENLPLHVFLNRKVQESKKRKQEKLKKLECSKFRDQEEENEKLTVENLKAQSSVYFELQPTRRQRKCAIGKQGLLAEISSSDDEYFESHRKKSSEKSESNEKNKKQKRESKEKRKERYIEKKHEQMIAKEQKAIEEAILREIEAKKQSQSEHSGSDKEEKKIVRCSTEVSKRPDSCNRNDSDSEQVLGSKVTDKMKSSSTMAEIDGQSLQAASPKKSKVIANKKAKKNDKPKKISTHTEDKDLIATPAWNKLNEDVGIAVGRRKRAAVNQLYYWSSSSTDEDELIEKIQQTSGEIKQLPENQDDDDDDRQKQHGWIVGDSHKKMITMLAMEKQMKEKRRRSENDGESLRNKGKKHRGSMS